MELSYFGAKVLHSAALAPAVAKRIPMLHQEHAEPGGARDAGLGPTAETSPPVAKGITSIDGMALLDAARPRHGGGAGDGANACSGALARQDVSVILISQASSEHTICFAIKGGDVARARRAIEHEFRYEFRHGTTALDEAPGQSIAAIVGEGMKGTPGVGGQACSSRWGATR